MIWLIECFDHYYEFVNELSFNILLGLTEKALFLRINLRASSEFLSTTTAERVRSTQSNAIVSPRKLQFTDLWITKFMYEYHSF